MPPRAVPPPPRPEPVTLDQICDQLTRTDTGMDAKAYHLVALNTVAFNPSVKLYFYEQYQQRARASTAADSEADRHAAPSQAILDADRARREALLKAIAFFLAQRLHPVSLECRWETVSLLGELCRMENTHKNAPTTPQGLMEAKLNEYAKLNLEYLACQLPWFMPAVKAIIGEETVADVLRDAAANDESDSDDDDDDNDKAVAPSAEEKKKKKKKKTSGDAHNVSSALGMSAGSSAGAPPVSREAIRDRLRARRQQMRGGSAAAAEADAGATSMIDHEDEDALIALGDILRALPFPVDAAVSKAPHWTPSRIEQAHDLMFLDASTTMLHLIPNVSRSLSNVCVQCGKQNSAAPATGTTTTTTTTTAAAAPPAFLRCSSCKAVYYCCAGCQRAHWSTAHRNPCQLYKEKVDTTAAEYDAMNGRGATGAKAKGKKNKVAESGAGVMLLEVPLEPALFYETRRYLFDHRDASFGTVDFNDYFMRYTVRGT